MDIVIEVTVVFIIFFLLIILGLQIQITSLSRRIDELTVRFETAQQETKAALAKNRRN
jgi:cell division protein FtsL